MIKQQHIIGERAIVIGGSIAGLLAARILADYFAEVIIVERDNLPVVPQPRQGVPQSLQPHILLTKGYRILVELFGNDFITQLIDNGALTIDWGREFYVYSEVGWLARDLNPSDLVSITCSRPLLEWAIAQSLRKNIKIKFWSEHRVKGLIGDRQNNIIKGITTQSSDGEEVLTAQLVVDCSGRGSKTPQWLKDLGFTPPPETVVDAHLGYATRRYKEPKAAEYPWKVMLINHCPPQQPRLGYLAKIEGGEWIATLGGYQGDFPPIDDQGFLDFARSLRHPGFYEAITQAEATSPIYAYRATKNRLRHYEKVNLPSGLIVLGDAVCSLCPVYGQGMTVSALAVLVLQQWLNKSGLDSVLFQKDLAKSNSLHWNLATTQDSLFLNTKGRIPPSLLGKIIKPLTKKLITQATIDPQVYLALTKVGHLIKSPTSLFSPRLLWQTLKGDNL